MVDEKEFGARFMGISSEVAEDTTDDAAETKDDEVNVGEGDSADNTESIADEEVSGDTEVVDGSEPDDDGEEIEDGDDDTEEIPLTLQLEAARSGLTDDQIQAFGSESSLRAAIKIVQEASEKKEAGNGGTKLDVEDVELPDVDSFELPDFDPNESDEKMAEAIKGMAGHNKEVMGKFVTVIKSQQEQNKQLRDMVGGLSQAYNVQAFLSAIPSLGDEWSDLVGKGENGDVTDKQFENRCTLFDSILPEIDADAKAGKRLSMAKALRRVADREFPEKSKKVSGKSLAKKARSLRKINMPESSKRKPSLDSKAAALRDLEEQLAKQGHTSPGESFDPMAALKK